MAKFSVAFLDAGNCDIYDTDVYADGFAEALKAAYIELAEESVGEVARVVIDKELEKEPT